MKSRKALITMIIMSIFLAQNSKAGEISDALGMYLANKNGKCRVSKAFGEEKEDTNIDNVCIPLSTTMKAILNRDGLNMDIITLGIAELNTPNMVGIIKSEIIRKNPL